MPDGRIVLLAALLALLVLYPLVEAFVLVRGLLDLTFTVVLLGALLSVGPHPMAVRLVGTLTVVALAGRWLPYLWEASSTPFSRFVPSAAVFAVSAGMLLVRTLQARRVTVATIAGALAVYLLMGLLWAHGYYLLDVASPEALSLGLSGEDVEQTRFGACVYFSYVTLTTLGYGDMAPISSVARSLAMTEAIAGQFYVAVLIARLVGIHAATVTRGDGGRLAGGVATTFPAHVHDEADSEARDSS